MTSPPIRGLSLLIVLLVLPGRVRGDGGTVRVSETRGGCRVTVFTSPTPLRPGPVDVSVLVQDVASGDVVSDARIEVLLQPRSTGSWSLRRPATPGTATNRLLSAAEFDLPGPGPLEVEVTIHRAGEAAERIRFAAEVSPRLPRWMELWPWFAWPILPIAFFALREFLVSPDRQHRRRTVPATGSPLSQDAGDR